MNTSIYKKNEIDPQVGWQVELQRKSTNTDLNFNKHNFKFIRIHLGDRMT